MCTPGTHLECCAERKNCGTSKVNVPQLALTVAELSGRPCSRVIF